ncbi:aminotransferase class IV [Porphyromonas sp. COT-239 OH1446]|uniref:aminotransferase class IV n=1 Tax=Porphyromonas sp. COT-239 OH1446 TaxID=1515613 RepID=UPI00068F5E21|nr:aminotransferase class IV [Porphyromonas sp. COT-239 OH1446]
MHRLPLLETLCLRGGVLQLEERHRYRMLSSLNTLGLGASPISRWLERHHLEEDEGVARLMELCTSAVDSYRLRLSYDASSLLPLGCSPYIPRQVRWLQPIRLAEGFDYALKSSNRVYFEQAKQSLPPDVEPLYYRADGSLSDTSYTNLILELEEGLYTPERPLLEGVQRADLLARGLIQAHPLDLEDLYRARSVRLINAMMPLEDCITLSSEQVLTPL